MSCEAKVHLTLLNQINKVHVLAAATVTWERREGEKDHAADETRSKCCSAAPERHSPPAFPAPDVTLFLDLSGVCFTLWRCESLRLKAHRDEQQVLCLDIKVEEGRKRGNSAY